MKTQSARIALALSAALVIAVPARADTETYSIDPGHSSVGFRVQHILSKVPGRFTKFSGTITMDPKDFSTAKLSVEIDPASINTDNANRDADLKSSHFFDVETLPKMGYESTSVVPSGPDKVTVKGNLTMHGVTKPVDLDVDVLGFAADPWGNYRGSFEGRASIARKDFGIVWNKTLDSGGLLVGETVEITINIEAVRQKAEAPSKAGAKSGR